MVFNELAVGRVRRRFPGQHHTEQGPLADFALDFDFSPVAADDRIDDVQTKTGTLADGLGGENGANRFFKFSGGMPIPVSSTSRQMLPDSSLRVRKYSVPPSGMA